MTSTRRVCAILDADVADYSRLMAADEVGRVAPLKPVGREVVDPAHRPAQRSHPGVPCAAQNRTEPSSSAAQPRSATALLQGNQNICGSGASAAFTPGCSGPEFGLATSSVPGAFIRHHRLRLGVGVPVTGSCLCFRLRASHVAT